MHAISDVTRKFSSRYLLARRKINASDLLLTSKFGVLRQICREIARHVGNNVHLNLSSNKGCEKTHTSTLCPNADSRVGWYRRSIYLATHFCKANAICSRSWTFPWSRSSFGNFIRRRTCSGSVVSRNKIVDLSIVLIRNSFLKIRRLHCSHPLYPYIFTTLSKRSLGYTNH